jgi:hypothetical protein
MKALVGSMLQVSPVQGFRGEVLAFIMGSCSNVQGTYTPLLDCYSDEMKALVGSMLQVRPLVV